MTFTGVISGKPQTCGFGGARSNGSTIAGCGVPEDAIASKPAPTVGVRVARKMSVRRKCTRPVYDTEL